MHSNRTLYVFTWLTAAFIASGAAASDRPAWVDRQDAERFPPKRYLTGVGSAPIGGNVTRARSFAADSARSELAKTVRTTVKSATSSSLQESLKMEGRAKTSTSTDTVKWNVKTTVDQSLQGVKIEEYWEDEDTDTIYALAVLDMQKLIEDVRRWVTDQQSVYGPKWLKAKKAAGDNDYVGALRAAEAVASQIPSPPDNYHFLRAISPGSVETLDLSKADIEQTVRNWLRSISVQRVVEPDEPLTAGKPAEIKLNVDAPELPVIVSFEPSSVQQQKLRVDEERALIVSVGKVQPGKGGQFIVHIKPDTGQILGERATLASAAGGDLIQLSYRVEGDAPLVVVNIDDIKEPCRADARTVAWQAVAACYQKLGYRTADLKSLKPEVFEQMQGVTINKFTYETIIERSLGPIAERYVSGTLTCSFESSMKLDGGGELHVAKLSYEERNLKTGQSSKLEVNNRAVEVTGAGPTRDAALKAAQARLDGAVCDD